MTVEGHELVMRAPLDDSTVFDDHDLASHTHGGKAVRDQDRDSVVRQATKMFEDLRLGDRLSVRWDVADLPMRARIPSLTIQPLLENAIYHGVERLATPGVVEIEGRSKGDMVYLSVRNPLPEEDNRASSGNRIALENIRERLSLAFGPSARLSRAVDRTHYEVSIAFPLREQ